MEATPAPTPPKPAASFNLHLDYRWIAALLLVVIAVMLGLWRPWHTTSTKDRTITVTGDVTLKAEADEFIFAPTYSFSNADQAAAIKAMSDKSNEITAQLKKLGVPDNKIETNANNWAYPTYDSTTNSTPYMLQLTITVDDKTLAQKVEDYLLTTSPNGQLTPQANFSDGKEKSLQNQGRNQATADARTKAEQSAKNLGFKLGAVKSVDDSNGFDGGVRPLAGGIENSTAKASDNSSLVVQPGENTLDYSVTVTYYIH